MTSENDLKFGATLTKTMLKTKEVLEQFSTVPRPWRSTTVEPELQFRLHGMNSGEGGELPMMEARWGQGLPGQNTLKICFLIPPRPAQPWASRGPLSGPRRHQEGNLAHVLGPDITSMALVAPELLARTWKRRVLAGVVCPPSREVPPL